jgi:hypothetical protein
MTGLIIRFPHLSAMQEWVINQEELVNNNPEPNIDMGYRKFDTIDRSQIKEIYVLERGEKQ